MSLRAFHLLFIALSVVLAAFLTAWTIGQYRVAGDPVYLAAGAASLASAGVLVAYGGAFQRKTRGW
jgi:hypothetical protein